MGAAVEQIVRGGVLSETARQEYLADNLDLLEDT